MITVFITRSRSGNDHGRDVTVRKDRGRIRSMMKMSKCASCMPASATRTVPCAEMINPEDGQVYALCSEHPIFTPCATLCVEAGWKLND